MDTQKTEKDIQVQEKENEVKKKQYVCVKCENTTFESDQFQATGGNFAKVFNVQNKKFITISCTKCGYTELYKGTTTDGWNILDFLVN